MAASSSMINTVPEREAWASPGCRMMTTASDIDCLPHQREFEIERRAFARMTFDPNFSRVFLNNAVSDRKSKPSTFADRKSTRLNSSHGYISYAVFCLKKKTKTDVKTLDINIINDNTSREEEGTR